MNFLFIFFGTCTQNKRDGKFWAWKRNRERCFWSCHERGTKKKILSPHQELSLRPESKGLRFDSPCDFPHFSLSHTRDKMKNIFLYFWNFLKILTQHLRLSRSLKLFFSGNYVRIVWLPGMYSSQRVFQYANFYLVFSFSVLCICFFL